jgi:Flp pilus assembly protein TadG
MRLAVLQRLRRFVRAREGATAVEFAMVAAPFLFMLFAVVELGLVFMVLVTLDNATTQSARRIRTGELQNAGGASAASFKTDICNRMDWIRSNCLANLNVDVRTYTQFSNANEVSPISNGTFNAGVLTFNPGTASSIVVVRSYYKWKLFTPFLDQAMSKLNGGTAVLTATAAFRNEPYS